ncbi:hypothetical protein HN51_049049 [Arachis hypogaea]|uniref:probably inactive leucine-rich repeat receptor-like protein kinase At5g48380 n=1 Tax=Arachis ipaensis TaxID=130454 RepID=UPI0007AF11C2|nr:probably inactive leucine-rich repeat receptor-like protein kinase At5g48380 [Arachis ipaensis]XP_025634671.1 probably inactive leucine-rich repeat receptor-like protein kinase At5g48380 [Arachis hypogaea]QHO25751.1 putative inactive leucine-rich repeat receptor-like protein kinase [Arachis hypogaea]
MGIILLYIIQAFLCFLLATVFTPGHATLTDIFCLKSIKESLEDPDNYLQSWDFSNYTEGFICRFTGVDCWHPDENRVLNLKLSNMGLKGEFPRGIRNCSSLTGLDLSINHLSGHIPSDISSILTYATTLDLSSNMFSGEIPPSLANCTFLNYLKLDDNKLSGGIPPEFASLRRLKTLSLTNNELSGPVPNFPSGRSVSYGNNRGLCGGPSLLPCSSHKHLHLHLHLTFKVALLLAFVFSFIVCVVVRTMCFRSSSRTRKHMKPAKFNHPDTLKYVCSLIRWKMRPLVYHIRQLLPLHLQHNGTQQIAVLVERLTSTMNLEELNDATESFSIDNAIGVGKMGIMYEGVLANGWHLAVKRLSDSQLFEREVLLEIRILGKLQHRNIVPLLGFCVDNKERILVYQYTSNGRLSKWLHPVESEALILTWPQRIKIALGMARALSWLHNTCNWHVVHLNVSSECVLLDESFEPKLSNFGEAKFMNPNKHDDLGMAFYVEDGKKDVFDLGSVLLELVTGKTLEELVCLSNTADLSVDPSTIYDAIDKSLIGKGFENEVFTLVKVACECIQPFPDDRPTMLQVYNSMTNVWEEKHESIDHSDMLARGLEIVSATTDSSEIVEL